MAHIALPLPRRLAGFTVSGPRERFTAPSARAISWIGMALLFVTAALSVYLVQISAMANAGYDLQRLETERKGWLARNEQLELELAKRRSLAWVESQAVQRLSMVRAEKPVYLQVSSENERETAPAEVAMRTSERSQRPDPRTTHSQSARPEPGNPAWALDSVRAWLALVAGH